MYMRVDGSVVSGAVVMIFTLLAMPNPGANAQVQYAKTWEFKVQDGAVGIAVVPPRDVESRALPPSLEIFYKGEPHPSLGEEVAFLRQVLHDLPSIGIDPDAIVGISMPGPLEPEVKRRLALASLESEEWRNFTRTGTGSAELILKHLLNSIRAYDAFNAALEEYGLQVKTVGAEKSASARCLDLKIPDLPCSVRHNPRVPTGASLSIILEKRKGSAPK